MELNTTVTVLFEHTKSTRTLSKAIVFLFLKNIFLIRSSSFKHVLKIHFKTWISICTLEHSENVLFKIVQSRFFFTIFSLFVEIFYR